jgi:hypothetical protein
MNNLFEYYTAWADDPCFYVVAFDFNRRAWLAGPYVTRGEAEDALPRAKHWAIHESGDKDAVRYNYRIVQHYHGHDRSILGKIQPCVNALASLAACRLVVERWEHGDLAEAARACQEAIDAYDAA